MIEIPGVRWRQRFQSIGKAFPQLSAAAELAKRRKLSELEQLLSFVPKFVIVYTKFTELAALAS